ncbi:T9SS type A sorting domain-containing protein [Taibaiella koreensis]|uniref:T9SS type A sorting domain-containing protein n=1 Tax=Taibaiella koreensis TaxID=1268548 RepID=UPI000E59D5F7|nr:T9SS type A sorting domain-containing protein [Taibaiella koreensis]
MKNIFKTILASHMVLAAGLLAFESKAQPITSSLTGGLSGTAAFFNAGNYTGFVVPGTFDLTFGNASAPALPAGSLEIKAVLPVGMTFDAYTPPTGWSYTIIDPQNAVLSNTADVGYGFFPPTNGNSTAVFHIPVKTTAAFTNRTYVAFIQGTGPFHTTPIPVAGSNSAQGTVSVANNPLPVLFTSFTVAKKESCSVELIWETAMEKNNDHFEVERSGDGNKFTMIGTVKGAGNSAELKRYSYIDEQPLQGHNIYRIRQVDIDKKSALSKVESAKLDCLVDGISVYPNPSNGIIYIKGLSDKGKALVYNAVGQKVLERTLENSMEGMNISSLANGIYQLQITNSDKVIFTTKLIKK